MSQLSSSIQSSLEEKRRRLEELKKKRQQASSNNPDLTLKVQSDTPRTQMPLSPRMESLETSAMLSPRPNLDLTIQSSEFILHPPMGTITYEREIQVEYNEEDNDNDDQMPTIQPDRNKTYRKYSSFYDQKGGEKNVRQEENPQEAERIINSPEFAKFFQKSTKIIERTLAPELKVQQPNQPLSKILHFHHDPSSPNCINSLQWSPRYEELLLASYHNEGTSINYQSYILLWSLQLQQTPEFVLTHNTQITYSGFHKFNYNLIVGGSYTGQLLIWDLRAQKTPVMRSSSTKDSHCHPICQVSTIGSTNANNLVSSSTEGKVCNWSLQNINQPTYTGQIYSKNSTECAVQCMTFAENETSIFYIGTEDGNVHQCQLHSGKNDISANVLKGHFGPLTSLDVHPAHPSMYYDTISNLLLTSSADWTVKMWNPKYSNEAIWYSDIYEDYVLDVKWHPIEPSLFAVSDSAGNCDLWDFNANLEEPLQRISESQYAVNKIDWSLKGNRLATGDSQGNIHVYQLGKDYGSGKNEEWNKLERFVSET